VIFCINFIISRLPHVITAAGSTTDLSSGTWYYPPGGKTYNSMELWNSMELLELDNVVLVVTMPSLMILISILF
jgi:hypothetical protein